MRTAQAQNHEADHQQDEHPDCRHGLCSPNPKHLLQPECQRAADVSSIQRGDSSRCTLHRDRTSSGKGVAA